MDVSSQSLKMSGTGFTTITIFDGEKKRKKRRKEERKEGREKEEKGREGKGRNRHHRISCLFQGTKITVKQNLMSWFFIIINTLIRNVIRCTNAFVEKGLT